MNINVCEAGTVCSGFVTYCSITTIACGSMFNLIEEQINAQYAFVSLIIN